MKKIITIMFHSVGLDCHNWPYPHISENYFSFYKKMRAIAQAKYKMLSFEDASKIYCLKKSVCLTFDDGYLDNWSFIFPLLKKYNLKATIFVNPDFVDPRDIVRPQYNPDLLNYKNYCSLQQYIGFLSWSEMKLMEQSNLVDIQSHGMTHTWYFSGPEIVDFWHPGSATEHDGPVWMLWNKFPEKKPFYLMNALNYERKIPYGTPIYEHRKSLESKKFEPNEPELEAMILRYVQDHGREVFFKTEGWRIVLTDIVKMYRKRLGGRTLGHFETDNDYKSRVIYELVASKEIIEHNLNKTVDAICWPGGGVSEEVLRIAKKVGYKYFTLPGSWKTRHISNCCENMISRITSVPRVLWKGNFICYVTGAQFLSIIESARGSFFARSKGKTIKFIQLLKYFFSRILGDNSIAIKKN
ncbi:MAG: polysaccharide deacetylase family protein [Bacilli bacterium]